MDASSQYDSLAHVDLSLGGCGVSNSKKINTIAGQCFTKELPLNVLTFGECLQISAQISVSIGVAVGNIHILVLDAVDLKSECVVIRIFHAVLPLVAILLVGNVVPFTRPLVARVRLLAANKHSHSVIK